MKRTLLRFRWHVIVIVFVSFVVAFALPSFEAKPLASKRVKDMTARCIGSGHKITRGIVYTIDRTGMCDGDEYRILASPNEPGVAIWNKDPDILAADMGSSLQKTDDGYEIRPP